MTPKSIPLYKIFVSTVASLGYYALHYIDSGLANAFALLIFMLFFAGWETYQDQPSEGSRQ